MKKYIVVAIDLCTNLQIQASDPHTWAECETLYQDYQEDYDNCRVVIVPVKEREE